MARLFAVAILLSGASSAGQSSSLLRGRALEEVPEDALMKINAKELKDKLEGFWIGQLVGNFMGLPFEFVYNNEPMPILPTKYYDVQSAQIEGLIVNHDGRGYIPQRLNELQGAYTDDDTDIEFVTLHAVEQHGLDISYAEIAAFWKNYIHIEVDGNEALWFANKRSRELMDRGMLPPATGSKAHNQFWWTIDPQLVNEIWSAFYPGMLEKAVDMAEWGARITSSDWGTHPTRFYAALYSAAFFVTDVQQLYDIAMQFIPPSSLFLKGLQDVKAWYASHLNDWRQSWRLIRAKYLREPSNCGGDTWNCAVSAMVNGLVGAMAFLYGGGDFMRTMGLAIAAGFDNDNQAATLGGLLGVMHGSSQIPRSLTHEIAGNNWSHAYNDRYINERRPPLPRDHTNTGIAERIMNITRDAILKNGGVQTGEGAGLEFKVAVSSLLLGGAPSWNWTTTTSPPAACCGNCHGKPVCSPVSGNCYDWKAKDYYEVCDCCAGCSGSSFCSPVSGNCYNSQAKDYYWSCKEL